MDPLEGPRLWWIVSSLCLALLLSSLESTIVSTALVSIASDFNNYGQSNWIIITYLLTYSSFLIVFARLSDIVGRKSAVLTSICLFTVFSLACGVAQSMTQLIVFRAFQGIGGSGIYALTMVIVAEITPKKHLGMTGAMVNVVFVVASAVGPVLGGAITTYSTWRWCFYLNVPAGAFVIFMFSIMFPKTGSHRETTLKRILQRIDWLGLLLCLAASIVIILPLQEGGTQWSWSSAPAIVMLAVGASCWIAFAGWEFWLQGRSGEHATLPMLPPRIIVKNRVVGACIITCFLTGIAFTSIVVYLPQRFQAVNSLSPVKSGVNILPILLVSAFFATATGLILSKRNYCQWLILLGNSLQLVGLGLHSALPIGAHTAARAYGYQAILGAGLGTTLSASFVLARIEVTRADIAPTIGTITQLRVFGGVIGVVICRVAQTCYLEHHLSALVEPGELDTLKASIGAIARLSPELEAAVREVYGRAFNSQFLILTCIAAANFLAALMTFRRRPRSIEEKVAAEEAEVEAARRAREGGDGTQAVELEGQQKK